VIAVKKSKEFLPQPSDVAVSATGVRSSSAQSAGSAADSVDGISGDISDHPLALQQQPRRLTQIANHGP